MDDDISQALIGLFTEEQSNHRERAHISLDMWGSCTSHNVDKKMRRTASLKPLHCELLRQFVQICSNAGVEAFVYGGTALGVFREGGRMIPFDYDIDFATLEYSQEGNGALSQLANFCLREPSVAGLFDVQGLNYEAPSQAIIQIDFRNPFFSTPWLFMNNEGNFSEKIFTGAGGKRAKFYFTHRGLREAAQKVGRMKLNKSEEISRYITEVHVDLFTLSPHPDSPEDYLRVNWHKSGVYDSLNKKFSAKHFLPLQKVSFEGVQVLAPSNLAGYLTEEYGYLGRDAMYDSSRQCYIKIPEHFRDTLPNHYKKYISESPCDYYSSCYEK